jgi:hypothetical protein
MRFRSLLTVLLTSALIAQGVREGGGGAIAGPIGGLFARAWVDALAASMEPLTFELCVALGGGG